LQDGEKVYVPQTGESVPTPAPAARSQMVALDLETAGSFPININTATAAQLEALPGIGPKTARAIIFHLKDKLIPSEAGVAPLISESDAEVIAALTGLGVSLVEAQAALQSLARDEDLSVEERVRQALAYFAAP